jgi:hypothetical protein
MSFPIKRETFKAGDLALYTIAATNEVMSVVIERCSYFCPAFDTHPEQSIYTVRLDGDIAPKLAVELSSTFPLIHGVSLPELVSRTASEDYAVNTRLWNLRVAVIEARKILSAAEKKLANALENAP